MITADALFRLAANAAAAHYRAAPAYIAYHTVTDIDVPSMHRHKRVERQVETRTVDDYAVLQDLPRGQRQYGHSFPLIPTFDALSYFRLDYNGVQRDLLSHVTLYSLLEFNAPVPAQPGVNAVAVTLKYYYAQYADDSTDAKAHLLMDPLHTLTDGNSSDFYLHDVYVDTATDLPTRVTYRGKDDTEFTVDYTTVQQHWLVSHAFYGKTIFAPLHLGRVHFTVDSSFDQFAFPPLPDDPKLIPVPGATPYPR
jgi:hypothetical protein